MPTKKQRLPQVIRNGRYVTDFDHDEMARICWEVARGKPLSQVIKSGRFSMCIETLYNWMDKFPEAAEMMAKARQLSTFSMEDKGLLVVEDLIDGKVHKDQVRAKDVALHHLRWNMGRRNPREFSEQARGAPAVAIQINTNALGDVGDLDNGTFHLEVPIGPPQEEGPE